MKLLDTLQNSISMDLFGKCEAELQLGEIKLLNEYRRDLGCPVWKSFMVGGRSDCFEVSNTGMIRRTSDDKLIRQYTNSSGYKTVWLHLPKVKNSYPMLVHRLVAEAFVPNPDAKPEVNHRTAIPTCNWYKNLEWVTSKENIRYMISLGHQIVGEAHPNSKFTEAQIREACKMLEDPSIKLRDIVANTGVSIRTLKHIRFNNGWSHISKDYNIAREKRNRGPVYAPVSKAIINMVRMGMSDATIKLELEKSGLSSDISTKSLADRIYHIRKTLSV